VIFHRNSLRGDCICQLSEFSRSNESMLRLKVFLESSFLSSCLCPNEQAHGGYVIEMKLQSQGILRCDLVKY